VVVQAVVPDVYGEEHMSFSRPGSGNYYESPISYCTLICESIRRIHEAKTGFVPNVYIQYGEETLKYLYVENLYQPIQYILDNIHETSEYEIYDEYRNVGVVLDIIRDVLEYKGTVHFENTRTSYNKPLKKLPYQHEYKSFTSNIRTIYKFLVYNHERFKNLY
jgi:nucleoside-diphosphate-sugar epimerase